jgi:hypothetical protein
VSAADCAIVRALVAQHGTAAEVAAFDRLVAKVGAYEWVLPVVHGDDEPIANDRALALVSAMGRGAKGYDLVPEAMRGAR